MIVCSLKLKQLVFFYFCTWAAGASRGRRRRREATLGCAASMSNVARYQIVSATAEVLRKKETDGPDGCWICLDRLGLTAVHLVSLVFPTRTLERFSFSHLRLAPARPAATRDPPDSEMGCASFHQTAQGALTLCHVTSHHIIFLVYFIVFFCICLFYYD